MPSQALRASAPARTVVPPAVAPMPWLWAADFSRQQSAVAAEGAAAVVRGLEAMRRIQEETARQVMQRPLVAMEKLRTASQPVELFAVQAELLRTDMETATRYWQQLTAAAMEMNSEVLASTAHLVDADVVLAVAHGRMPC